MAKYRILVVDDEEALCEILKFNLEVEGYEVDTALSAEEALEVGCEKYDLLILDVMMGAMSGFKLAQRLKAQPQTASIPIIFCTARSSEDDTVAGLNIGADDYITKPFSMREVLARVRSVLRRVAKSDDEQRVGYRGLQLDFRNKSCTVDGRVVQLTKKEFEILWLLLSHPGNIYSRDEILNLVWHEEVIVLDRTVDVNITRLRKKIGEYGNRVVTRQGFGYGFEI